MELCVSDGDTTARSTAVNGQLALTERLFAALDGIRIDDADGGWITEVLGIHTIRGAWWVQIAARGDYRRSVLLQLLGSVTADETVAALRWWSLQPLGNRSRPVTVVPQNISSPGRSS
jgi:hypothetical protein